MRKFRFNIASLLVIILVLGVGFAALRESSDLWQSGVFTATIVILLSSILLAVHRTESKREFWVGFALFGCVYVGLSLMPLVEFRLITTKALGYLDSKVPRRLTQSFTITYTNSNSASSSNQLQSFLVTNGGTQLATVSQGEVRLWVGAGKLLGGWSGTTENFVRIGHSLCALLVGWLGGQLSRRLDRASRHADVTSAVDSGRIAP
jgi:hypothetical protein